MYNILKVREEKYIQIARNLFLAYQSELGKDLCFQDFENELQTLPGVYSPPNGELLLITDENDSFTGCVALKKRGQGICEMKRLYIMPKFRKCGYGKVLAEEIMYIAKQKGYNKMVLDTLEELKPAINLYKKLGFHETEPYYKNPLQGVIYMEKDL